MTRRWEPMLATSGPRPASLGGWACEPKLDGWRALVEVTGGKVRVTSRNGATLTEQVPSTKRLVDLDGVVLDGEIVHGEGTMDSFYGLFGALHRGSATFVAFDVLATGDGPLVGEPYVRRRAILELLDLRGTAVVPSFPAEDLEHVLSVCEQNGMEGVVLKRRQSIYRSGRRSTDWRKVKCAAWSQHLARRMADRTADH